LIRSRVLDPNDPLVNSLNDFYKIVYEAVDRSLDIYLEALEGRELIEVLEQKPLLKIGELASLAKTTVPTVRHWTREGLLNVAEYTPGGYQLYTSDMVEVARQIRKLQNSKRLTLKEIKKELLLTPWD